MQRTLNFLAFILVALTCEVAEASDRGGGCCGGWMCLEGVRTQRCETAVAEFLSRISMLAHCVLLAFQRSWLLSFTCKEK